MVFLGNMSKGLYFFGRKSVLTLGDLGSDHKWHPILVILRTLRTFISFSLLANGIILDDFVELVYCFGIRVKGVAVDK